MLAKLWFTIAWLALGVVTTLAAEYEGLREINRPAAADPDRLLALCGATMIDGYGGPVVPDSVILIRGNKIVAASTRLATPIPSGAKVIDVAGYSILPGLLDAHFHMGAGPTIFDIPALFLSHGVTTVRDPGRPIEVYLPMRELTQPMPRAFVTGPHFDQAPPAWPDNAILLAGPPEARQAVDRYVEQGASAIKVYFRLPLDAIRATCDQADLHAIPVTGHLELVNASDAIRAGMDGIEHVTSFGTDLAEAAVADEFRNSVRVENEARQDGRYRLWATLDFSNSPRVQPLLDLLVRETVYVSPTLATFERRAGDRGAGESHVRGFENMLAFVGLCHQAGVRVVTGSHTWSRHVELGWAYQREMELLVECGLTPLEVIRASTVNNARFFGCAARLGSIESGKLADLVVIDGRPDEDIKSMYNVRAVMLNGQFVHGAGFVE